MAPTPRLRDGIVMHHMHALLQCWDFLGLPTTHGGNAWISQGTPRYIAKVLYITKAKSAYNFYQSYAVIDSCSII